VITTLAIQYGINAVALTRVSENVVRTSTLAIKAFGAAEIERAEREAALLAHLNRESADYRVPSVVSTLDGAPCARTPDGALVVMKWCDGHRKVYTTITEPEWSALGNELAALHTRLDDFPGSLLRPTKIDLDAERDAISASRAGARAKDPARGELIGRYLDARLALLDGYGLRGSRSPPGAELPIHNDYNQHNYLFDGKLPPVILDWEGAIAATREYEVVRCLNHLPLVAPTHAAAFVAGYRQRRPLEPEGLRWAIDRSLVEHALKSWPLERWLADLPGADAALFGSIEVLQVLSAGVPQLAAFFGVDAG
jgi:Ser/Thr protein kinase RdoA (MazF antagonist)